jgi:ABC-type amino acid transport substrate-binding protein
LDEPDWERTVNLWLELQRADGTIDRLYDYWILGKEPEGNNPRWSVMRDVLGWVD